MRHFNIKSLVIAILFSHSAVAQSSFADNELKSLEAQQAAAQLKRVINDKLQQIVALELAAGVDINDIDYGLQQIAQSSHERFGALLSANNKGLILSITPNSPASKLGLVSGDVIINVNNASLNQHTFAELLQQHYLNHTSPISIKFERDGRAQYLSGELSSLMTPAWTLAMDKITLTAPEQQSNDIQEPSEQCGRVIVGKFMPREKGDFLAKYSVVIKEIDGVKQRLWAGGAGSIIGLESGVMSSSKTRFKLKAGKHTLMVSPRSAFQQEENSRDYSDIELNEEREFVIDIAANTTYYLVYDTRKDSLYSKTNMPIIWQTQSQACQL